MQVSETTLQLLVEGIRDYAIFMLDPTGRIETWNTGARLVKGYTADEAIGQHFSMFYPREDVEAGKCERELAIAIAEGQYEERGWRVRKDGSLFWANVLITAIRDATGRLVGFGKVTRDLTREREADEARRRDEERFRLLVDGVKEYAIFMLDPEGYVATWNEGAERIKGYRAHEIIGKHFSVFYPAEAVDDGRVERELKLAVEEGRFEEEGWRVRKDGTKFWANVVLTALHDHQHRLVGFAKVTRDLTERRKHEEERLQLARTQEALRLRDEFLSIASHELKTPLAIVRLQLEVLSAKIAELAPALVPKLERTQRAGRRLDELVESLLDVTRIATGKFVLSPIDVDLAKATRDAVDRLRELAEAAGCTLTCTTSPGVIGRWDPARVDQIFTNLISNAIKYAAGAPITVATGRRDGDAFIDVRDHGPGLPPGSEQRIFDRFERASSMRHFGGLGLGLFVVAEIVKAHGGRASASNVPGGGACFRVLLPIENPA